jgi:surface carbohydrate biosynthesis protein (TIGR04326 family)
MQKDVIIIPELFFLRLTDWFYITWQLIRYCFQKKLCHVEFRGINVTKFCDRRIRSIQVVADFILNVLRYCIARRIAKQISAEIFLQTYENYSWEKMTIVGLREIHQHLPVYGFQHAFISRSSFKYFPDKDEVLHMPLPDRIITMGQVTRSILLKYGCYGKTPIVVGCALRQSYQAYVRKLIGQKRRVLIPLTMVASETKSIIEFLINANLSDVDVILRPHPATLIDKVLKRINVDLPPYIKISQHISLMEEFNNIDMVLYTWSTVAIEALACGIPVIYLDVLTPMNVDPLFECSSLKLVARTPRDLQYAINQFYIMSLKEFQNECDLSQEYLRNYFSPISDKNLEVFCN